MRLNSRIYVAGHTGLVGSAIVRELYKQGYSNIITKSSSELDLRDPIQVNDFFYRNRPEYVFLAAAKVGGISFNKKYPASFIYDNLMIQSNVIDAAYKYRANKLLFLGSACIYPKLAEVPIKEEALMTGPLEPTNDGYAIAKIAGMSMCQKYKQQYDFNSISLMPNNLYGIYDNFRTDECHVIPALINKFIEAKEYGYDSVTCFGDGSPTREFLFSDDLANAAVFLMNNVEYHPCINIGPNREVSIKELSELIAGLVRYKGEILWDTSMPNGTPRRTLDTSKMDALGWNATTSLEYGLKKTIDWYLENRDIHSRVRNLGFF